MIKSIKLKNFYNIKHGFFNNSGGVSSGIYKSLNCGIGSNDKKKYNKKFTNCIKKIGAKKKLILLHQIHSNKIFFCKQNIKKKIIRRRLNNQ